ncbi:MAG: right-handed parallel beta-helix repeat-containing protein [Myxococcales bacterium]|nr:right-handed parallel beta-helix repeat-containing protein [Myxococcales bacterium]
MLATPSLLLAAQVLAATIDVNPGDDLWGTLKALGAGDEVIIHAGTYAVPGFVDLMLPGTEGQPILIRAGDGEEVIIQGIPEQNTFNVQGSWYTLRGLKIVGGSHGIRVGTSDHATFEDIEITTIGDVGISCNRPDNTYEAITIRGVHIHDTGMGGGPGECMYLGCNDDGCQMWDSTIEFNWCHDTLAGSQGDGIELKTGSYNNVIRHNVIHDVKYPGITIYGTVGNKAPNVVEGNAVWASGDNGIQTVGDAIVRNNLVFAVGANGIHAKPSQGEIVENLTIVHNTILNGAGICLRGNQWPGGEGIVVAGNAFYCEGGTAIRLPEGSGTSSFAANAVVGGVEGVAMGTFDGVSLAAAFADAAAKDVYPADGSPLVDAGDPAHAPADDFNCLPRDPAAPDAGAYDRDAPTNPGWAVAPGFKTCADLGGDTTGGVETSGGSDTSGGDTSGASTTGGGGTTGASSAGTDGTGGTSGGGSSDTSGDASGSASTAAGSSATASDTAADTSGDEGEGCACGVDAVPQPASLLALFSLLAWRRRHRS